MQRAVLPIAIASLALVALNFIFDFKRRSDLDGARFDLESAGSEQEDWFHRAEEELKRSNAVFERDISRALALTQEFRDRSRSEAETLEIVRKMVNDLGGEFERLKAAGEAAAPPAVEEQPEAGEVKRDTLTDRFMDTSLEKLEAFQDSMPGIIKTYEGQLKIKLLSPENWRDQWEIIHGLEEHYGVQLNDEERTLLQLKFDSYRGIFNASKAYYLASLDQKVYELIEKDGEAAHSQENTPQLSREESRKVMASINKHKFILQFMKDENPELYRTSLVPRYVVHSLVDEVKTFFEERGAK